MGKSRFLSCFHSLHQNANGLLSLALSLRVVLLSSLTGFITSPSLCKLRKRSTRLSCSLTARSRRKSLEMRRAKVNAEEREMARTSRDACCWDFSGGDLLYMGRCILAVRKAARLSIVVGGLPWFTRILTCTRRTGTMTALARRKTSIPT